MQEEKYIGYLKYSGKSVEDGLMDARKSAEALLGFDEILRYFLLKEDPSLRDVEFEIPVRIKKGSWQIAIPEVITLLLTPGGVLSVAGGTYLAVTANKAAKDGLFQTGLAKDIKITIAAALKSTQWVIRISSHLGILAKKEFENVRINPETQEIDIPNTQNEYLKVPKKYLDIYQECPPKLFSTSAGIIQPDGTLEVGIFDGEKIEKVDIPASKRDIYFRENSEKEEIFLPELKHDQYVELEGGITRITESENTVGFRYEGHTLVCRPENGNIADFKEGVISKREDHIFPRVKITGVIDRASGDGSFKKKRPEIIFSRIVILESEYIDQSLF